MRDEELIAAFERCELSGEGFTHAAHVRVAWWYLRRHPFEVALERFKSALQRFAAARGASGKYHETMTVSYMALIAERLQQTPHLPWPAFAETHPELLARTPPILSRYYSDETLRSERAKRVFVLPDRGELPVGALVARRWCAEGRSSALSLSGRHAGDGDVS